MASKSRVVVARRMKLTRHGNHIATAKATGKTKSADAVHDARASIVLICSAATAASSRMARPARPSGPATSGPTNGSESTRCAATATSSLARPAASRSTPVS